MKFKVGDRVKINYRVLSEHGLKGYADSMKRECGKNHIFKIERILGRYIYFDNSNDIGFKEEELIPIKEQEQLELFNEKI